MCLSTKRMMTCFEDLCNELLHSIFEYIDPRELYEQFMNLNQRLNRILASLCQLQLVIKDFEDENLLEILAPHIAFLCVNTWDEINLSKYCNLRFLSIDRPSSKQLKQIRAQTMPKLVHLSLFTNVQFISPDELIFDVFSNRLPFLRWARLGHIESYHPLKWSQSYSLRYLHISCFHTNMMLVILSACPNLRCFHIDVLRQSEMCPHVRISSILVNHPLRKLILQDFCRAFTQQDLQTFILSVSNVEKLQLNITCKQSLIDFLQYIVRSLPNLNEFHCDIIEYANDFDRSLKSIYDIHPSFCHIRCRSQGADYRILTSR